MIPPAPFLSSPPLPLWLFFFFLRPPQARRGHPENAVREPSHPMKGLHSVSPSFSRAWLGFWRRLRRRLARGRFPALTWAPSPGRLGKVHTHFLRKMCQKWALQYYYHTRQCKNGWSSNSGSSQVLCVLASLLKLMEIPWRRDEIR